MYPSDLPDMYTHALGPYTQALGPLGPRAWVYISDKSRGHVIQLICTMRWVTNHPSQYEATRWINYIESLVKFDYGSAASNVAVTFINIKGKIL